MSGTKTPAESPVPELMADLGCTMEDWRATPYELRNALIQRWAMEKQGKDQMSINLKFMIEHMDKVHAILCPDDLATWQDRATRTVIAAQRHQWRNPKKELPDDEITVLAYIEEPGTEPDDGYIAEVWHEDGDWILVKSSRRLGDSVKSWCHPFYPPTRKTKK